MWNTRSCKLIGTVTTVTTLILLISALIQAGFPHAQSGGRRGELKAVFPESLAQMKSSELQLEGIFLGMSREEMKKVVVASGLVEKLYDQWFLSKKNGPTERDTGISIIERDQKVAGIALHPLRKQDLDTSQRTYVTEMSAPLRHFFEHYSDSERVRIFGTPSSIEVRPANEVYKETYYIYAERGFRLDVEATREMKIDSTGRPRWDDYWTEQISALILFPPNTQPPY